MAYKCILTMGDMGQNYDSAIARLADMGIDAVWDKGLKNTADQEQIVQHCKGYDFVIAANEKWGETALEGCKDSLKLLIRYGIGADSVDVHAASERNIPVTILPGCNALAVAEQAVALMIDCLRKVSQQDREIRLGNLEVQTYMTHSLCGKTIGLLGCGNIAKDVVRLLRGFHCKFLAYDIYPDETFSIEENVQYVSAEEVLRSSDVVSIHMPATEQTHHYINRKTLAMMKSESILINTARGELVNTDDLIEALNNGTIAAAGLDVFGDKDSKEEVPAVFMNVDKVVMTRHSGANTYEIIDHVTDMAIDAIDHFLKQEPLKGILNPEIYKA